jgi:simple sugar transport system permease protein
VQWRRYLAVALPILILSILATLLNGVPANLNRLVTGSLAYAGPVAIGALAGIISERSGVLNIAIEGKFLMGAAAGTLASSIFGVAIAGPIAGALMGAGMGFLLAWFGLRFKVDQIIVGVVINIAAAGITDFLFLRVFSRYRELNLPISIDDIRIPFLADLPVLGSLIFVGSPYLYGSIALVLFFTYMLYRTTWGLRLRAAGEQPSAAGTVGVDVIKLRYRAMLIAGALAGLAGSALALSGTGGFAMGISAGRGFIALAAVIFGAWNPIAAFGAALVFAFADSAQSLLSILGVPVPPQFLASVPYIITIVVVAGLVGRVRGPAAAGQPYEQG